MDVRQKSRNKDRQLLPKKDQGNQVWVWRWNVTTDFGAGKTNPTTFPEVCKSPSRQEQALPLIIGCTDWSDETVKFIPLLKKLLLELNDVLPMLVP